MLFFKKLKNRFTCTETNEKIIWNVSNFETSQNSYFKNTIMILDLNSDGSCKTK
jgi:hypothetical protein